MKKYTRFFAVLLMLALLFALGLSVVALAEDDLGGDTPIIEWPFDDDTSGAETNAPTVTPGAGEVSPLAIVLIILGSIVLVAVAGFFINWFFVLGRSAADLKKLFAKKPEKKGKK